MARCIWGVTGIAWAAASLFLVAGAEYWDATSLTDYLAVWSYTAAWLLAAPTVVLIARTSGRATSLLAMIFAAGAIVTATANALEDAIGLRELGIVYVVGSLVAWLALVPLSVALWRAGLRRLAGVTAAVLLGIPFVTTVGGVIIFGALAALAFAPAWFSADGGRETAIA